nr:nucleotidyltransferase family protein [Paenibacillus taihuensis]
MLKHKLILFLMEHDTLMDDLRLVRSLQLPQCYIAAGCIRNYVWDRLSGYSSSRSLHDDIDVVYYDADDLSPLKDAELEQKLIKATENPRWSVKNQARMHVKNGFEPYHSTSHALSHWPEMVTAIGVRLNDSDQLELCCPHGLADLFEMRVQRSPYFPDHGYYVDRITKKGWDRNWPKLTIIT